MSALVVKATVAMFVVLAAVVAARRMRASRRHLMLAALFLFLLLLPAVQQLAPAIEIPVQSEAVRRLAERAAELPRSAIAAPAVARQSSEPVTAAPQPARGTSIGRWLMLAYAAGAALLLAWLAIGIARLFALARRADVWLEGTARMNEIARAENIRRPALVVRSDAIAAPLTFGFRRSTIVLPDEARRWSADELARALRHELEHVRRDDWVLQLVARLVCALWWPHPLIWIAWRRFCVEAERACDDAVVGMADAEEYAGQLVALARRVRGAAAMPALPMASRSRLAQRVSAILDATQPRGPRGALATAGAFTMILALLVALGPSRLVAAAIGESRDEAVRDGVTGALDEGMGEAVEEGVAGGVAEGVDGAIREALIHAAASGDLETVRRLLDAGMSVDTVLPGDGTPLIAAAREGREEMVGFLLDRGADVNLAVSGDGNPLIMAAREGHLAIVALLLDRGARIDEIVPGDENALIQAAGAGHTAVVQLLIARGAEVSARARTSRGEVRTPLRMARRGGFPEIEELLLRAGARE